MAVRIPRPRLIERFGSYNNLRSNPYSNSEKILDVRNGVLDPYTQIAQSTYKTLTLSILYLHLATHSELEYWELQREGRRHIFIRIYTLAQQRQERSLNILYLF